MLPYYQKYGYDEKTHTLVILEYPELKNQGPQANNSFPRFCARRTAHITSLAGAAESSSETTKSSVVGGDRAALGRGETLHWCPLPNSLTPGVGDKSRGDIGTPSATETRCNLVHHSSNLSIVSSKPSDHVKSCSLLRCTFPVTSLECPPGIDVELRYATVRLLARAVIEQPEYSGGQRSCCSGWHG